MGRSLGALLWLGAPLLLGNKGCEAEQHEGDPEAGEESQGHGDDAAQSATGQSGGDNAPLPSEASAAGDAGAPKPDPQPTRDAAVAPSKDASVAPTSGRCGTRGGVTCASDEFCQYAADTMCGAADQGGTCMKRPELCTAIYKPVCGCDGKTYASECDANGKGIAVASTGECNGGPTSDAGPKPSDGKTCGGFAALQCESGQFCNYEIAAGGQGCEGIADGAGVCNAMPKACTKEYKPVCGCDRRTYGTECEAHSRGASVLHTGACTEVDCKAIGGHAVDGIGPAPKCPSGEIDMGAIVYANGQIAIEGTICCVE